jgi:cytochrome b561
MSRRIQPRSFSGVAKVLHWTTAAMVLAMLGIGAASVGSLGGYHALVNVHRPLGIAVLAVVAVRLTYRLWTPPPPLPATVSRAERVAATTSEYTLYTLMLALPLVGWGMTSASRYPVVLVGSAYLPDILPHDVALYAVLRKAHTALAYALGLLILAHLGAVLSHTLVVRDGLLWRMLPQAGRPGPEEPNDHVSPPVHGRSA